MFESRTETLREHIAYLESILSNDAGEAEEIDQEELQEFLDTCQTDIDDLRADLPYDEIEEDDIPIEDFSGDNLEDAEIEDEVVEVEHVIEELQQLMETARERFLEDEPDSEENVGLLEKNVNLSESEFDQKLRDWLSKEIRNKCRINGIIMSDEEVIDLREKMILCAATRGKSPDPLFSVGLNHITMELIQNYEMLGRMMNFDNTLNFYYTFWENVI